MSIPQELTVISSDQLAQAVIGLATSSDPTNKARICLVGPNGAGKSRLLDLIRTKCFRTQALALMVDDDRAGKLSFESGNAVAKDIKSGNDIGINLGEAFLNGKATKKQHSDVFVNLREGLMHSTALARRRYFDYCVELAQRYEAGKALDWMSPPVDPLPQVQERLSEALGFQVRLTGAGGSLEINCEKHGRAFGSDGLSAGERQLVELILLSIVSTDTRYLFLIDEPELHLNAARVVTAWSAVEEAFPTSVFVYATHSLTFATTPGTTQIFLVESEDSIRELSRDAPLPSAVLRDIVGARVQIATSEKAPVFCEDALHSKIVDLFLQSTRVMPIVVNGWEAVARAVRHDNEWRDIRSQGGACFGLVDRDYRSEDEISSLTGDGVFVLPMNEAEAILMLPSVMRHRLSIACRRSVSEDEYADLLAEAARSRIDQVVHLIAEGVAQRNPARIQYDMTRAPDLMISNIRLQHHDGMVEAFRSATARISQAISEKNVEQILELTKSKILFTGLQIICRRRFQVHIPDFAQFLNEMEAFSDLRTLCLENDPFRAFVDRMRERIDEQDACR